MKKRVIDILNSLGLNDNEANVYQTALSLGPTNIAKIARSANIKRTTVYLVIESLKQRGLMSEELKGFKRLFVAESPQKLSLLLKSRQQALDNILPELNSLYNLKGQESTLKYYEGVEAMKAVYEENLKRLKRGSRDEYLVVSDAQTWTDLDPEYFKSFVQRRAAKDVESKMILQDSPAARKYQKNSKTDPSQVKIVSNDSNKPLRSGLVITKDRVCLMQTTNPVITIVIENAYIVKMHKEMFNMLWNTLPDKVG